ncbi:uncharacterized protein [Procambarus clarkii]|uniref:uncharacterized protein n=1 Tax=Procambarus clarkii TaxID=6728 RepID=UPI0037425E69
MADRSDVQDSCNLEISACPEPHLEATQDLELLAQEIAEAAVEEKRSSNTSSPTPSQQSLSELESTEETDKEKNEEGQTERGGTREESIDVDEEKGERPRSDSPVDEASWVLVDAEVEIDNSRQNDEDSQRRPPEYKFSVFRKFLARGDLRQKLTDIGLTCDPSSEPQAEQDDSLKQQDVLSLQELVVSCSESMVICDMPKVGEEEEEDDSQLELFLKDLPDCPKLSGWRGTFSGAQVVVVVERQGGLVVAGVTVRHIDLLSALASLQQLVTSTGLVSYADIDVPSLLARAA